MVSSSLLYHSLALPPSLSLTLSLCIYIYIHIICLYISDRRCGVLQATDKISGWGMIDAEMGVGFQPTDTCLSPAAFAELHDPELGVMNVITPASLQDAVVGKVVLPSSLC